MASSLRKKLMKARKDFLKKAPKGHLMCHKLPKRGSFDTFDMPPEIKRLHRKQNAQLVRVRKKKPDFIC